MGHPHGQQPLASSPLRPQTLCHSDRRARAPALPPEPPAFMGWSVAPGVRVLKSSWGLTGSGPRVREAWPAAPGDREPLEPDTLLAGEGLLASGSSARIPVGIGGSRISGCVRRPGLDRRPLGASPHVGGGGLLLRPPGEGPVLCRWGAWGPLCAVRLEPEVWPHLTPGPGLPCPSRPCSCRHWRSMSCCGKIRAPPLSTWVTRPV